MGAILGKFRKEKSTIEVLEILDEEIKEIEEYTISTQARQKRYVGNFLVISIGLYILCFLVFYFAFFPPTWMERITYSVPLLLFPLFIFLLKHMVAWFFQTKLNKKSVKLRKLKAEKKKVLEKVMDKETYKVALEILNRFGDKSNGIKGIAQSSSLEVSTPNKINVPSPLQKSQPQATQVLSRRLIRDNQPQYGSLALPNQSEGIITTSTPLTHLQAIQQRASPIQMPRISPMQMQIQQHRRRTPFPILNTQNKGVLDKLVDYLIGDGIQNRFAMICKECYGHNGMALQEEYEFTSFRCIYCNALNASKKFRPVAPKLPSIGFTNININKSLDDGHKRSESSDSGKTSSSEKFSASESEDEKLQLPNKEEVLNSSVENEINEQVNDDIKNKDKNTEKSTEEKIED